MSDTYIHTTDAGRFILDMDATAARQLLAIIQHAEAAGLRFPKVKARLQHQLERRAGPRERRAT